MEYRTLGKSGIKLSEISLGSWLTFGEKTSLDTVKEMTRLAFDHGINFFDNAEVYANGGSELLMGEALRDYPRKDIVVSTKIFFGGAGPNNMGHSFKRLVDGTKNSLRRLQLDYVDLLYCHRRDDDTSIEEAVRAMDILIRQGHALYWGTSMWNAKDIDEAYRISKELNTIPPSVEQTEYNMFFRNKVEDEFKPLYKNHGMGVTSYSPLASGVLTGKYNDGIPKGSRLDQNRQFLPEDFDSRVNKVKKLAPIAQKLGCTLAEFSIAWCLKNPNVSTVLTAASNMPQFQDNLKAVEIKNQLDCGIMKEVDDIMKETSKI